MTALSMALGVVLNALQQVGYVLDRPWLEEYTVLELLIAMAFIRFVVVWIFDLLDWEVDN